VKDAVDVWAYGRTLGLVAPKVQTGAAPSGPAPRDLMVLLSSLHLLLPYVPGPAAIVDCAALPQPLSCKTCPAAEVTCLLLWTFGLPTGINTCRLFAHAQVKKAYLRAARFVHPDKLPGKHLSGAIVCFVAYAAPFGCRGYWP
jgi:hypothetical protein